MESAKNNPFNLAIILGAIGLLSGIILLFGDSWQIGLFGSIASAAILFKGIQDSKKLKTGDSNSAE